MRINYLLPRKGTTKPDRERPDREKYGFYRCEKCLMIFYSDIKCKKHECYEKLWWRYEYGDEQARQVLEKSGRLEEDRERGV
jgi:hypothetical protein